MANLLERVMALRKHKLGTLGTSGRANITEGDFPRQAVLALKLFVLTVVVIDLMISLRHAYHHTLDVETIAKTTFISLSIAFVKGPWFWLWILLTGFVFVHEVLSL